MDLDKLIKDKKIRTDKKPKDDSVLKNSQFAFREITKGLKKSSLRPIRKPRRTDALDKDAKPNALGVYEEPEDKIDSEFIEVETMNLPLGISEDTRRPQNISEDTREYQTISEEPRKPQKIPDNTRTYQKNSEDIRRPQKVLNNESFPLSPDRMDFLLLDGHGKKLIEVLIEHGAGEKPVLVESDELKSRTGQSTNHLSDTIIRMEKKGYLKVKKSYGKGIFEVNPSIF